MKADKIIKNGNVYSVLMDDTEIRGTTVAIADGKIAAVGGDEIIEKYTGDDTEIIDAKGNSVMPAFCDAHVHPSWSGSTLFACNLFRLAQDTSDKNPVKVLQSRLKKYIDENPDKTIIKGCGWDYAMFGGKGTVAVLDEVCSDKPVCLESYCQHHLWVNTKALELVGLTKDTPDVKNGMIQRDKDGNPSGILSEFSAMDLVKNRLPEYYHSVEEYKEIIRYYQREYAHPYGVTMVFDALSPANAKQAYKELAEAGELEIRVADNEYADPTKPLSQFDEFIAGKNKDDVGDLYRRNTVKFFMESAVPDMCFIEPYKTLALKFLGRPKGYKGYVHWDMEVLKEVLPKLMEAGFQIHTHAMGDGSVRHTMGAYEFAVSETGKNTRNVVAHLMLVHPDDYKRMADTNTIACVQPTWMAMSKAEIKSTKMALGKRVFDFHPYKRFLDAGVVVSAGTDFPVMPPPDPFIEMEHALTRKLSKGAPAYDGSGAILASKKTPNIDIVTKKDVIKSRTISAAYQCFFEDVAGTLEVGKSADIIVLNRNLETAVPETLYETKVDYTFFKGNVVYRKDMKKKAQK